MKKHKIKQKLNYVSSSDKNEENKKSEMNVYWSITLETGTIKPKIIVARSREGMNNNEAKWDEFFGK